MSSAEAKNAPIIWLRLILKPVMRFCLRNSLKLQEVIDACKATLVEAAQEEMQRVKRDATVSRLSIMTGVHRPDVTRILASEDLVPSSENAVARLIGQWQGDLRFSSRGKPKVLNFDGKKGQFAELVASVSSALNPYTVLFELERIGAVEHVAHGLKLVVREYVKRGDPQQTFRYLSRDCDDLLRAGEENALSAEPNRNLHLQTEYDNVGISYIERIRKWFIDEGNAFHAKARMFLSQFDKDLNQDVNRYEPTTRVVVCTFSRVDYKEPK